jgi:hypothetical protein
VGVHKFSFRILRKAGKDNFPVFSNGKNFWGGGVRAKAIFQNQKNKNPINPPPGYLCSRPQKRERDSPVVAPGLNFVAPRRYAAVRF